MWTDFAYALRAISRAPLTALSTIGAFTLGIGLNIAVFCVVNAVLVRPLPFANPSGLVALTYASTRTARPDADLASVFLDSWRAKSQMLEGIAAYNTASVVHLNTGGQQAELSAAYVSRTFFNVLGASNPVLGRVFEPREFDDGAPVVIASYSAWLARFGGDSQIIGRLVTLGQRDYVIVGVMAPSFRFPAHLQPDVLFPMPPTRATAVKFVHAFGRLHEHRSPIDAERELADITSRASAGYPTSVRHYVDLGGVPRVVSLQRYLAGDLRLVLLVSSGVAALVLLLACVNIVTMLLVRTSNRQPEFELRQALGATPRQLVCLGLVEPIVLGLIGTTAALVSLYWAIPSLRSLLLGIVSWPDDILVDKATVLGGTALGLTATLACTLFILVIVLVRISRAGTGIERRSALSRTVVRVNRGLVAVQVALSFVLVVASTLLVSSLWKLSHVPMGFSTDVDLLTCRLSLGGVGIDPTRSSNLLNESLVRLSQLPGVGAVGASTALPLRSSAFGFDVHIEGIPLQDLGTPPTQVDLVSGDYFSALGAKLVTGRFFDTRDTKESQQVAIVNQTFVRERLGTADAIGRRVGLGGDPTIIVSGVIEDVRSEQPRGNMRAHVYRPFSQAAPQMGWHTVWYVVRPYGHATLPIEAVRRVLSGMGYGLVPYDFAPMPQRLASAVAPERQRALLFSLFASFGVALALSGLYSLVAYAATLRQREFGIRAVLGASRLHIATCVIRETFVPVVSGLTFGIAGAVLAGRTLERLLFGLTSFDGRSYLASAAVIVALAALASAWSIRRVSRIDPLSTLREL